MEKSVLKDLLNDVTLLRFVKKHSANNLLEDNKMANGKFKITTDESSISILDKSATKLLVTNAEFEGEDFVRYNIAQLSDLLDVIGSKKGELIIPAKSEMREMLAKVDNNIIVICPLPAKEKSAKK